jgi:hypothetical protein
MNVDGMNLFFVDVEAVGPSPATGLMTEFGAVHFWTRQTFHGVLYESEPDPRNPAKSRPTPGGKMFSGRAVMQSFADWIGKFDGRPNLVSDNNGYDAMWIAYEFDSYHLENPFGHSSRRISDFYAGLRGDFRKTQEWKKWRVTPHTHQPVDDAMGNVEAFATILKEFTGIQPLVGGS